MQPSANTGFVVRVRRVAGGVEITLQEIRTRQLYTFSSWPALTKTLQQLTEPTSNLTTPLAGHEQPHA